MIVIASIFAVLVYACLVGLAGCFWPDQRKDELPSSWWVDAEPLDWRESRYRWRDPTDTFRR